MRHVSIESTLLLFLLVTELPCPEVLFGKGVLESFAKFTGKHMCQSLFFNKVAGAASKFEKFLKAPFFFIPGGCFYRDCRHSHLPTKIYSVVTYAYVQFLELLLYRITE